MFRLKEKKVISTKRSFMRKPIIEDVDQFYNVLKKLLANRKVDETDGIEIMYLLDPKYWGEWICIRSSEKFHSICNRAYVCKKNNW